MCTQVGMYKNFRLEIIISRANIQMFIIFSALNDSWGSFESIFCSTKHLIDTFFLILFSSGLKRLDLVEKSVN